MKREKNEKYTYLFGRRKNPSFNIMNVAVCERVSAPHENRTHRDTYFLNENVTFNCVTKECERQTHFHLYLINGQRGNMFVCMT